MEIIEEVKLAEPEYIISLGRPAIKVKINGISRIIMLDQPEKLREQQALLAYSEQEDDIAVSDPFLTKWYADMKVADKRGVFVVGSISF